MLGGEANGYQQIRLPTAVVTDVKVDFKLHTPEHCAWLEAAGTVQARRIPEARQQHRHSSVSTKLGSPLGTTLVVLRPMHSSGNHV